MKIVLLLLISVPIILYPQNEITIGYFNINSPDNIKKFANFLFCEKDYLRAIFEYQKYISIVDDDTSAFKIGLAYSRLGNFQKSAEWFKTIKENSKLRSYSNQEYYASLFRNKEYYLLKKIYKDEKPNELQKLYYLTYFFTNDSLPPIIKFIQSFADNDQESIENFYELKKNPAYKNELTAILLSTIIPGAGKIYLKEYGDGIIAFIATSLFGYLAYSNFNAKHNFRGWLFSGISAFFYGGSIYGSASATQIYNARIDFNFYSRLNSYLEEKNYFVPEYDFCK